MTKNQMETLFIYEQNLKELLNTPDLLKMLIYGGRGVGKNIQRKQTATCRKQADVDTA